MSERIFYSSTPEETSRKNSPPPPPPNKKSKKKIDFIEKKKNTIKSLNEVEYFLNDLKRFKRYLHLYKFFK